MRVLLTGLMACVLFHTVKFILNFLIMAPAWRLLHVSPRVALYLT